MRSWCHHLPSTGKLKVLTNTGSVKIAFFFLFFSQVPSLLVQQGLQGELKELEVGTNSIKREKGAGECTAVPALFLPFSRNSGTGLKLVSFGAELG